MKAIVLSADNNYINQLTTIIKSICLHNKNIKFYILNDDIPKEWFIMIREKLTILGCEIKDIKLVESEFENFSIELLERVNYRTYFRYVIPDVVEEKTALYLDVDIIVDDDISHLFNIDFGENYIAAIKETDNESEFNAGVIVFDIEKCKEDNTTQKLIDITKDESKNFPLADQSVLNYLFPQYKKISRIYNWQPGLGYYGHEEYKYCTEKPKIIHYSTSQKPWNTYSSGGEFRDLWWHYNSLDWHEIYLRNKVSSRFSNVLDNKIFILTNSAHIENIDYLVENLPEYQFNIAAYTFMAPNLKNLAAKDNVFIYPNVDNIQVDVLLESCSCYLDINAYAEMSDIVNRAKHLGKKVLAFDNMKHREDIFYDDIILHTQPEKMVRKLKEYKK